MASLARTWEQSYHRSRSLYGISDEMYLNEWNRLLFGRGQGSTIGPFLWLLCFLLISLSLSSTAPKIESSLVEHTVEVQYVGEAFIDDTGLGTNKTIMRDLPPPKDSVNIHSNLISYLELLAQEWVTSLWEFTSQSKITFSYPLLWRPPAPREHNKFLMDHFMSLKVPHKTLEILNHCRIYLQVITLSEIATANGLSILPEVKLGCCQETRVSTLQWPNQGRHHWTGHCGKNIWMVSSDIDDSILPLDCG